MYIDLQKIAKILGELGYSEEQIESFRKRFFEVFTEKLGRKVESGLTEGQYKELERLLSSRKSSLDDIVHFLRKLGLEQKTRQVSQDVFDEMIFDVLEKLIETAPDDQKEKIRKTLLSVGTV